MNRVTRWLGRVAVLSLALPALPVLAQADHRIDPDHLARYWILLNTKVDAQIPNSGRNLDKPGCAAVSYMVGSDGVPRNLKLQKVVPASDLGQVALSAVGNFRYGPSLTNRNSDPVDTYYIVPFNLPADPAVRKQIVDACRLPGYSS